MINNISYVLSVELVLLSCLIVLVVHVVLDFSVASNLDVLFIIVSMTSVTSVSVIIMSSNLSALGWRQRHHGIDPKSRHSTLTID